MTVVPDQFYTPSSVARRLVSFLRSDTETCVADFAAGDGELLRAATAKWPEARYLATDIDPMCVAQLKQQHPSWEIGRCDFLNERSRASSKLLRETIRAVSLVLLNPPFSCRGNRAETVVSEDKTFRCSTSMAFVLNSLQYLAPNGRLVAVLPASSLSSQKDGAVWAHLRAEYSVRNVAGFGLRTFPSCAARTVIVRLQRQHSRKGLSRNDTVFRQTVQMNSTIVRGAVPMHSARNGLAGPEYSLVHTTDLQGEQISKTDHSIRVCRRFALGPSVLIARVGRPSNEKCVVYLARTRLVLSDCVYAIGCETSDEARKLHAVIHANWDSFANLYSGTCAPYLTVSALHAALLQLGVNVTEVQARSKV
jgi:predicted RNA methylase